MNANPSTVLHVDDDPMVLQLVNNALSSRGYEVISQSDPTRATTQLLDGDCRLVILDIDMPGINGLDLLKEIKKQDGGIQVIMLTGLVSMNTVLRSMRWGAEACLFKPITDFDALVAALDAAHGKLDRWWGTLEELTQRKRRDEEVIGMAGGK